MVHLSQIRWKHEGMTLNSTQIFPALLDIRFFFPNYLICLDDLPLFVERQHHPDAVSSLVDLLDVVLPRDLDNLPEHILHLSRLPLSNTLLSARRHISVQSVWRGFSQTRTTEASSSVRASQTQFTWRHFVTRKAHKTGNCSVAPDSSMDPLHSPVHLNRSLVFFTKLIFILIQFFQCHVLICFNCSETQRQSHQMIHLCSANQSKFSEISC